jgi:outer membrane receptor protein involved in Fe transport
MMITRRLTCLLLLSTALSAPALAHAAAAGPTAPAAARQAPAQEETDISLPGVDEIVVVGQRNITRATSQVVSVLSTAEIARTGEGNIAGALSRVPGLSVVGSGYVYVRGLGDRYSLALLNGSPLPSPEPLKRVVPLDLFPSSIVSSSLVQKSYSANFPGEFGGGVINLTTRAVPQEAFLSIGGSISGDTETTGNLGYTYYGSRTDWTGYDNGARDVPPGLAAYFASGERISSGKVDTSAIAGELVTGRNAVVQKWNNLPPNASASFSAGKPFDLGWAELGVIAAAGYSNKWATRDAINQSSLQGDLSDLESNFRRVTTDQRLVANGLFGLALDFGDNTVRWTNVYIHDTVKHARLGLGNRHGTDVDYLRQDTAWFERQLIDTQVVGEFELSDNLSLDARAGFANSSRKAPGELSLEYVRTNTAVDPYGDYFINRLNNGNGGDATISYSDLDEDLWSAGVDATYRLSPAFSATLGYAYADTSRTSSRRDFQFQAPNTFPGGVDMFRPDYLLQPSVIEAFGIALVETNEGNPAFLAKLRNHAGYLKVNGRLLESLQYDLGVRYETAREAVSPIQVFSTPGASLAATSLDNSYWLPAATLTWEFQPAMQIRLNASKTIGRPQFRELIYQFYFDPDTDRTYRGNPLLTDSELTNAEARYEWYFAGEQHFAMAGFYKRISRPIEAYVSGDFTTSFANAPRASLYGVEFEAQKNYDLAGAVAGSFWADRRIVLQANYTLSKSELQVRAGDKVTAFAASSTNATDYFRDGAPLTGQSRHVANLQIGLENGLRLSQQTLMLNYASKRVTSRGLANSGQPDVIEYPGVRIDFVWREGFEVRGREVELKLEARNLTGVKYQEYQSAGANRVYLNSYDLGRTIALSAQAKF